jgi:drug/metabolite transporter (DMT)-like permease
MTFGLLLGFMAALGWGGADFMARFATRAAGAWRTALYMQFVGLLALSVLLLLSGEASTLFARGSAATLTWGLVVGVLNAMTTVTAYLAFEVGVLAIVAPICAGYPAIAVLLATLSGETLTPTRAVGVGLTLAGVALTAIGPSEQGSAAESRARLGQGVLWALSTALTQGLTIWVVGFRLLPEIQSVPTVWVMRIATFGVLCLAAIPLRRSIAPPRGKTALLVLCMGGLDAAAYAAHTVGLGLEQVSVVSVLGSLYGAVTGLLGFALLRERLSRIQWLGFLTICVALVLLTR